jgi:hypothetical protein
VKVPNYFLLVWYQEDLDNLNKDYFSFAKIFLVDWKDTSNQSIFRSRISDDLVVLEPVL